MAWCSSTVADVILDAIIDHEFGSTPPAICADFFFIFIKGSTWSCCSISKERIQDFIDCISNIREYDAPYHVRFAINNDVRSGLWYDVNVSNDGVKLERRHDLLQCGEVRVCAFDIETTKLPLKLPDAEYDSVMMISYLVDGKGYLIINREVGATTNEEKNHVAMYIPLD
ncbi:hypothetical protein L2E82_02911 [Cichorium intybus]|uniref:Uncharacterized protein n=1 Tax=Cichorium intybus TaxID=13427 RepID=A0ACB9H3J0_CICIN|nr:hypothetical protein L2E82_02911 [Cichorium intybus]